MAKFVPVVTTVYSSWHLCNFERVINLNLDTEHMVYYAFIWFSTFICFRSVT